MTPKEAREVIEHCHQIRASVDKLLIRAVKALRRDLRLVHSSPGTEPLETHDSSCDPLVELETDRSSCVSRFRPYSY